LLPIKHLSAYHLTIEKRTPIEKMCNEGKINEISENESIVQYQLLCEYADKHHFVHYEISNFALPNWHSKHNSAYWTGTPYIGIGPSAHSFDGYKIRRWNFANINKYIKHIDEKYFDEEYLTEQDRFNEYLITRLRTQWGASLDDLKNIYPKKFDQWKQNLVSIYEQKLVNLHNNYLFIPKNNWLIADYILKLLLI
jgi:oxygen-independent coproporphyrinogen-3 oxidase